MIRQKINSILAHEGFMKYFRNTSWLFVSRVISMILSFIVTTYVIRQLGPTNYGVLSYSISFVAIFSFISTLGIDNVLYREIVKYPNLIGKYLFTGITIKAFFGSVAMVTCITFAILFNDNSDISLALISVLSIGFIFNSLNVIGYEFQSKVESKHLSIASFIIVMIISSLKFLAIYFNKGIIYISFILLLESIVTAIVFLLYRRFIYGRFINWKFDMSLAKKIIYDSWPIFFATAFTLIYSRIDQIFIRNMIDSTAVGYYDAAVRISEAWYFIPNIIVSSFFPAIVNAKDLENEKTYSNRLKRLTLLLLFMSIGISILVTFFSPIIIKVLYGSQFIHESTSVLRIYIWGGVGVSLGVLTNAFLTIENLRKALFVSSVFAMSINVVLNILWIPIMGIDGAAWATLISYSVIPISMFIFKKPRQILYSMITK